MPRGVTEVSVSVFDESVNWLGGDLVNSFRAGLEKAYSVNLVESPSTLTHVYGAGATSICWRSDSEGEVEDSSFTSEESRSGREALRHRGGGKSLGRP